MTAHNDVVHLVLRRETHLGTVAYLNDLKQDLDVLLEQVKTLRFKVIEEIKVFFYLGDCPSFPEYTTLETQFNDLSSFIFDAYMNFDRFTNECIEANTLSIKL